MDLNREIVSHMKQTDRGQQYDLLKSVLRFDNLVNELEMSLRNYAFDTNKQKWISKGAPLVNEEGISTLRSIIAGHLNNAFVLSNFDEHEVNQICLFLGADVIDLLALNYKDWEIDPRNLSIINTIIMNNVFAMLKGSYREGIRSLLRETQKSETKIIQQDRSGRGLIPRIMGGGREN